MRRISPRPKRKRFLARAATGDWDCIIITHSAFRFIPIPAAFERAMIQEQLDAFEEMLTRSMATIASAASASSG